MNVLPYLKEVEAYDFVVIRVQCLKGFCRQKQRESLTVIYPSWFSATHKPTDKQANSSKRQNVALTVHGFQSDQTGDKVVKVDTHVGLRVAQDDQLEKVVGQLET